MKKYIKIARPDHWVKNAFIVPGIVIAILLTKPVFSIEYVYKFIIGFFATCFIASANYVINEWLDAEFDKYHPTKKNRPVVSENMKFSLVMLEYAICICIGVGLSLLINRPFLYVELWLLVMGVLYNVKPIRTKDIPYMDVYGFICGTRRSFSPARPRPYNQCRISATKLNTYRILVCRCVSYGYKEIC